MRLASTGWAGSRPDHSPAGLSPRKWYRTLPRLSVTQAAVAQLSVPVIAALGAAVFLEEALGLRFAIAAAAVLSGLGLVLSERSRT